MGDLSAPEELSHLKELGLSDPEAREEIVDEDSRAIYRPESFTDRADYDREVEKWSHQRSQEFRELTYPINTHPVDNYPLLDKQEHAEYLDDRAVIQRFTEEKAKALEETKRNPFVTSDRELIATFQGNSTGTPLGEIIVFLKDKKNRTDENSYNRYYVADILEGENPSLLVWQNPVLAGTGKRAHRKMPKFWDGKPDMKIELNPDKFEVYKVHSKRPPEPLPKSRHMHNHAQK